MRSYLAPASDSDSPAHVSIVECSSCQFGWQFPNGRSKQESVRYFETAYANAGNDQNPYFDQEKKQAIAKMQVEFINGLPTTRKRLLDVGGGSGIFANEAAQNGWQTVAVDPAMQDHATCIHSNPRIVKGGVTDLSDEEVFDVITLWDVIEHVDSPLGLITECKKHLCHDGWLILETGNFKSASRVEAGKRHWIYQLDHRWYFAPESLKEILVRAGFAQFAFSKVVFRPWWKGHATYPGPSLSNTLRRAARHPLEAVSTLRTHRELRRAAAWNMAGIDIFTIAACNKSALAE